MKVNNRAYTVVDSLHFSSNKTILCNPDIDGISLFPVRVYDAKGKLKKTISVKQLRARPMETGQYDT